MEEKDAAGMLEWMHEPEFQKYFQIDMMNRTMGDAIEFIRNSQTDLIEGQSIHYAIVDDKDEYLGTISLKNIDLSAKKAEYAVSLRKMAQRKGIATEATKELLRIAFNQFGFERVYLNVLSDNSSAIHLYEKCGFVYEGAFRKHLFLKGEYKTLKWYSILKDEYNLQIGGGINRIKILKPANMHIWINLCGMEVA